MKVDEASTTNICKEVVLFNSDTLSKIISYLSSSSVDLLSLALTSKRFGISDDDKQSIIEMSADILVREIATEEQLAALPHYEGESSLADYDYLQLMRSPLTFDQFTRGAKVNEENKTCVKHNGLKYIIYATAFSNNILRAGKHYASFRIGSHDVYVGVMRPGKVVKYARGCPIDKTFLPKILSKDGSWRRQ